LAVFRNGGPFDAVGPVCNASGDLGGETEVILAALVDHSLVRIVDTPIIGIRVRLLNTIREFAHEQLEISGELEAMRQAHAAWYGDLVIQTPPETWRTGTIELRAWTMRHLSDLDNFTLALEWLAACPDKTTAMRVVNGLVPFWLELGQLRDGSLWTERLIVHIHAAPIDVQAGFYRVSSIMALKDDTLDVAHDHAVRALELALQVGPPRMVANNQNLLGQIHWRRGNPVEGERLQRAAIATAQAIPDPLGGAFFASQIADSLIETGDLDRAEPLLREALPVVARERPEALPLLHGSIGNLALRRRDLDEASHYLELSLDYHRQPPHRLPAVLAARLFCIAVLAARRGRHREGGQLLAASLTLCERIGFTISLDDRADAEELASSIQRGIGVEAFERNQAVGRSLPLAAAIALALEMTHLRDDAPATRTNNGLDFALTPRERDVLALLVAGKSNPEIADALFISQRTVTTHLSRLYAKLDVSTRTSAIAVALRSGLADVTLDADEKLTTGAA
ncbi:MAG: LuxR C-terminal-related transcriptional regulator, partial [Thermomicrobiales bacterium]